MGRISTYKSPKVKELEKEIAKKGISIVINPSNSKLDSETEKKV